MKCKQGLMVRMDRHKVYQQNHSLLTSPKYDLLSLYKIWVKNIHNQMAFEVFIWFRVIVN